MTVAHLPLKTIEVVPEWAPLMLLTLIIALVGTACSYDNKAKTNKMNIPYFVYRDVNRNGEYDLTDRPYAGQVVFLEQPDGSLSARDSNLDGFANFAMSLNNDVHDISATGQYRMMAEPALGWMVTSGNASQEVIIEALEGSPGGLVSARALLSVGVAPTLTITGKLHAPTDSDITDYFVTASSGAGRTRQAALSAKGIYSLPVENGVWRLDYQGPEVPLTTRVVEVSGYPVVVSAVRVGERLPRGHSTHKTIGFDDLTHSDTLYKVPNGYAELNWHNWIATHHKFYRGYGYVNGTVSGEYVAYNSSGHPAAFSSAAPFDFLSVYVAVAWTHAERGFIEIKGWRGEEMVYRDRIRASVSGPIKFQADYLGVTRVEFSTEHYWQVVLDNLTISVSGSVP